MVYLRLKQKFNIEKPQNGVGQREKFGYQLDLLNTAINTKTILLGDFNLDCSKNKLEDYSHKNYFRDMELKLAAHNLIQIVDFITWTWTVNGQVRSSVLDHIYTLDPISVHDLRSTWPVFTDHALVMFTTSSGKTEPNITICQAHLLANFLNIPLMYNFVLWNRFLKKYI